MDIRQWVTTSSLLLLPTTAQKDFIKAVVKLVFTEEEIKTCSPSGRIGPGQDKAKPQLDPRKQKAILGKLIITYKSGSYTSKRYAKKIELCFSDYLQEKYPQAQSMKKELTNYLGNLCKNANKLSSARHQ